MRIHNRIPRINNKYIRNIEPEINYPKYEEVIKRKNIKIISTTNVI
jgi:hypothetical protein